MRCLSFVVRLFLCLLVPDCCLYCNVCCSLWLYGVACCLIVLFVVCCVFSVCGLVGGCCLLFVVRCASLVVCYVLNVLGCLLR